MKILDYQGGRDQFGRKYPIKIVFKEGKIVYGHAIKYTQSGDQTTNIIFQLISNIEDWCKNINEENREILNFDDVVIEQISVFKDY
jgi:hypothetical protein